MMSPSFLFLLVGSIYSMGATQSTDTCNSCCQGPAGLPGIPGAAGIPGSPGSNGLPGRDGMTGERGDPGVIVKGEKGEFGLGETGLPGEKGTGERGLSGLRGTSGKIGPRGLPGDRGSDGGQGPVGFKGERGESGHSRKSAFTAIKTGSQTGNIGDVVTFQETPTNINNHFSLQTDKFTCQVPGTYVFMFSIGVYQPSTDPVIWLVNNGNRVLSAHARTGGNNDYDHASNSAILNLQINDQVWLQFAHHNGRKIHSNNDRYSSFSGFLLYELD